MKSFVAAVVLLLAISVQAAEPTGEPHKFWSKRNVVGFLVNVSVRTADSAQTCYNLNRGYHEYSIPSQSCTGVVAWNAGAVGAELLSSALLHKMGWHKAEAVNPYLWAAPSVVGIVESSTGAVNSK